MFKKEIDELRELLRDIVLQEMETVNRVIRVETQLLAINDNICRLRAILCDIHHELRELNGKER